MTTKPLRRQHEEKGSLPGHLGTRRAGKCSRPAPSSRRAARLPRAAQGAASSRLTQGRAATAHTLAHRCSAPPSWGQQREPGRRGLPDARHKGRGPTFEVPGDDRGGRVGQGGRSRVGGTGGRGSFSGQAPP